MAAAFRVALDGAFLFPKLLLLRSLKVSLESASPVAIALTLAAPAKSSLKSPRSTVTNTNRGFTSQVLEPGDGYFPYIQRKTANIEFPDHLKGHSTMPLVWLENGENKTWTVIGGRSHLADWAIKTFPNDKEIVETAKGFNPMETFHEGYCCRSDEVEDPHMFSTCLHQQKKQQQQPQNYDSTGVKNEQEVPLKS